MAIDQLETRSVQNFLDSLATPVHVIILYVDPSEMDAIESNIKVEMSTDAAPQPATDQVYGGILTRKAVVNGWVIHRVGRDLLTDPARLIEIEERIRDSRQPPKALCAYPLKHIVELDMSVFVGILSLHDYVLFPRFAEGQRLMLEAVEEALASVLGRSGSEMIYRFAHNMGVEREQIPAKLRPFRHVLRELLGVGAGFLERFIFQRLYLKLRSSPQVACVDG